MLRYDKEDRKEIRGGRLEEEIRGRVKEGSSEIMRGRVKKKGSSERWRRNKGSRRCEEVSGGGRVGGGRNAVEEWREDETQDRKAEEFLT